MFARILCYFKRDNIKHICKQIIPAAKFAKQLAIANLCKLLDMGSEPPQS